MTKKVLILVEGPTEEAFVKQVLAPALPALWLVPTVVKTKIGGAQPEQGGFVTYKELKRQLCLLLRDTSAALVTTMLDYQGMDTDFPGRRTPDGATAQERVEFVEAEMKADLSDSRYLPYLALHEFEAMLFAKPEVIAEVVQDSRLVAPLREIRSRYPSTPEEINDSPATSPSARIETACSDVCGSPRAFRKRTHGPIIAGRIGLGQIRSECPHFDAWLKKLEFLANQPTERE